MESRISALEAASIETRDRLVRIETRLDAVATKADLLDVKADLRREINAQTWKLVTFVCSFGTALVGATYFMTRTYKIRRLRLYAYLSPTAPRIGCVS
jgi:hypothetical protein